ncbi:MAG: hypothetical protein WDM88_00735 [Galbitalea sp.]
MTTSYLYNVDGQGTRESVGGSVLATASYSSGRLTGVVYPSGSGDAGNGTALSSVTYSPSVQWTVRRGRSRRGSLPWRTAMCCRSSGRVCRDTVTDGSTPYTSTYSYDAAGRLTAATIPDNTLAYSYASTGGCGADAAAGGGWEPDRVFGYDHRGHGCECDPRWRSPTVTTTRTA